MVIVVFFIKCGRWVLPGRHVIQIRHTDTTHILPPTRGKHVFISSVCTGFQRVKFMSSLKHHAFAFVLSLYMYNIGGEWVRQKGMT